MSLVYKYPLTPGNPIVIALPRFATVLHIGAQDDGPVVWARVDPSREPEARKFYVYGTGHPIDDSVALHYLGTCQTESGLVWHVFEKPIERNVGELLLEAVDQINQAGTAR